MGPDFALRASPWQENGKKDVKDTRDINDGMGCGGGCLKRRKAWGIDSMDGMDGMDGMDWMDWINRMGVRGVGSKGDQMLNLDFDSDADHASSNLDERTSRTADPLSFLNNFLSGLKSLCTARNPDYSAAEGAPWATSSS